MFDFLFKYLGGNFYDNPMDIKDLSLKAQQMIMLSINGLTKIVDNHGHMCGIGDNELFYVNPCFFSLWYPFKKLHYKVFESACGVRNCSDNYEKNIKYLDRLRSLINNINVILPYQMNLLAMTFWRDDDGTINKLKTGIYCSNFYVNAVTEKNKNNLSCTVSIHPYESDAIEQINYWYEKGIRCIKWLPNSMNIDPSSEKCKAFYEHVKKLNMKLLIHVGHEHSVDSGYLNQEYGNPLRLRYPLDIGVKIVAAHCASEGASLDTDADTNPKTDNFDLFLRLMNEKKYEGLLFADISCLLGFRRIGKPLTTMLDRTDLHHRLLYGSDYPVPCINFVIQTKALRKHGYIEFDDIEPLNEIYYSNPLLFNFVVSRVVKSPEHGNKFHNSMFERSIAEL